MPLRGGGAGWWGMPPGLWCAVVPASRPVPKWRRLAPPRGQVACGLGELRAEPAGDPVSVGGTFPGGLFPDDQLGGLDRFGGGRIPQLAAE